MTSNDYSQLYQYGLRSQLSDSSAGWLDVSYAAVVICRLTCDGRTQGAFIHMSDNSAEIRQLAPLSTWRLTHQGLSIGAPSPEGYPGLPYSIAAEFQKGAFQACKRSSTYFMFVNISLAEEVTRPTQVNMGSNFRKV